ncbi:DUF802 domain-containing protein [Paraburkholderia acidisoli]|uniref:DUF802 domain-containing protein n=1 Tax=Paraburkholderia acidisoli TaxID=2571748 RepID=A0A7Z2GKG9_9BURK|nr:DUF802 domain-containing protein [Paraburkholderia acidisoli]QGZ63436.1 DUF802 domain-containing protein [Paraburkholderia acidisoli]
MSRFRIDLVVFAVGLAAVCWIGAGYLGTNALALAVTLLIGACYLTGAWELHRYRQTTAALGQALTQLGAPPARLASWLDSLPASLRNAVRARVEGERAALPGPALAPYLTGLLVLLGMLGTLLGMVVTLKGTGSALESATDLDAIRASLAAPLNGLRFAFGTSIAGVATSAMLGLLSALVRRERIEAAQQLDAKIATTLRVFSPAHQRDESFKLMQRQADAVPALVGKLDALMTLIERQGAAQHEQQLASQQAFAVSAEAAWSRLAASVGDSLKDSAAESARAAGAALQPVMQATMAGLSRESAALHATLTQAVQTHLDGVTRGFEASTAHVADNWNRALAQHRETHDALAANLGGALERFNTSFEARSTGLLEGVSARFETAAGSLSQAWQAALAQQERTGEKLAAEQQQALGTAASTFEQHSAALLRAVDASHAELQTTLAARDKARLASWAEALAAMSASLRNEWDATSAAAAQRQQEICATLSQTARDMAGHAQQHAAKTIGEIERLVDAATEAPKAAANLHHEIAQRDAERMETWTASLANIAATLRSEWEAAGATAAQRQQEVSAALAQTAHDIAEQSQQHATKTLAEIDRLVDAAAEAPKAAANLHNEIAERDQQRFTTWTASLAELAGTLRTEMAATHATLAQTARDIAEQSQQHATKTLAEIDRLVDAAAEAPKAAANLHHEIAERDQQRFTTWTASLAELAGTLRTEMAATLATLAQTARDIAEQSQQHATKTLAEIDRLVDAAAEAPKAAANLHNEIAERDQQRFTTWTASLAELAGTLRTEMAATHATLAQTAHDIAEQSQQHATKTLAEIDRLVDAAAEAPKAAANLHHEIAERDQQRFTTWTASLADIAATLRSEWDSASAATQQRQQAICASLAQAANDIVAQSKQHARDTIAEIERLVQAASVAPQAAAEVVAELRQKLSDSMVRDTAMLEERSRLLATLETLLDAVNRAATEQRAAVDGLVSTSADLLERVGGQFSDKVDAETGKLGAVAAQVTGSAVEVASLGDAFGAAVGVFGESNDKLVAHLERIEAALDKSLARSDDQLAYYVAQAREVIDLSMLSQKQIVENLQQLAGQRAAAGAESA